MYENVSQIFKDNGVIFAYLFGSKARGDDTSTSDIDIAVMLRQGSSKSDFFQNRLGLIEELSKCLGKDVDLIVLNDLNSLLLKYTIVSQGERIYCGDLGAAVNFESITMAKYFDFRPFLQDYRKSYVERYT